MARAIGLAERGRRTVAPNPMVGCVVLNGGQVVGEGWHERPGGPHAEVRALEAAGSAARGGIAVVTLEPCDHHGRTGPCSLALVEAGVSRVVFGLADPHAVAAGGAARLASSGVAVEGGLLAGVVAAQNREFAINVTLGRPAITLKLAQTPAGDLHPPEGRWVTGADARRRVHQLRARADAVLVGVGTVLADDPRLDVRHVTAPRGQPRPAVLDSHGRTPTDARVVRPGAILLVTESAPPRWRASVTERGAEVVVCPSADGRVALGPALSGLFERGIYSLLAEPGTTLAGALVQSGMVDRLVLHVAGATDPLEPAPCTQPPSGYRWRPALARRLGADREWIHTLEETG